MIKITSKVLEDYALSYARIECCMMDYNRLETGLNGVTHPFAKIEYIQLRSIDSITDEECIKFYDILFGKIKDSEELKVNIAKDWIKSFYQWIHGMIPIRYIAAFQYLQSIGITTPTIDEQGKIITVEEMVEAGVLKLTE